MSLPASLINTIEQVATEALPALESIARSLIGGDSNAARIRAEALAAHAAIHAATAVTSITTKAISSLPTAKD